jgi:hypothetical protein
MQAGMKDMDWMVLLVVVASTFAAGKWSRIQLELIDPFNKSHNALFSAFDVKFILFNFIEKNKFQKNTFDVERGK